MNASQGEDSKFAHLLQPIRDLAGNWDINIASELEEYLDVLEHVTFSFEGGPTLNFAEAALVIQGSACVYSKKVEYLHTLVHQALEFIAEKRKRDTSRSNNTQADDDFDEFDDEEQFLNLDDVLEEGTEIDLDENSGSHAAPPARPPAALLALEDSGGCQGDGDAGNYRIANCSVHLSGALLLESRDGDFLDEFLQRSGSTAGPSQHAEQMQQQAQALSREQQSSVDPAEGACMPDDSGYGCDAGGFSDDDNDGGGPMDYDEGANAARGPSDDPAAAHGEDWLRDGAQGGAQPEPQRVEEELFDPYAPLDMNDKGTLLIKPFKKGRRPRKRKPRPVPPLGASRLGCTIPPPSATVLCFSEFGYALKALQQAERAQQARQRGRSTARLDSGAQLQSAFTQADAALSTAAADGWAEDDDDDNQGGYDYGGPQSDHDSDTGGELPDLAIEGTASWCHMGGGFDNTSAQCGGGCPPEDPENLTYEELCRAHIEAFISAAAAAEVQSELASRVSGWRAKIQPILDEQDARPEFDIHAYGERFLDNMAHLSLSDPAHPEELQSKQMEAVSFQEAAGQGEAHEISRMFSAMLQLINNGNVVIHRGTEPDDPFSITLKTLDLPHHQFMDYRAPSFMHSKEGNSSQLLQEAAPAPSKAKAKGATQAVGGSENRAEAKTTKRRKATK
ncbi:hypothetical protein WJX72_007164 [[Myrmecia] bisecta]|uniref:Condensin-2 complex subunit H2 n=1 Tax=[Myrmecia] bisecta TaxID=41462 RepID=A0AAW1PK52_9CHLO